MDFLNYIKEFIKPELFPLMFVLYFLGMGLKKSKVKDNLIPLILSITGVFVSGLYVFATSDVKGAQDVCMALFTSIVQGGMCAGVSVLINQLYKQSKK